ncbi:MAG: amidase family protein [Bryobacteraceae bacterium]
MLARASELLTLSGCGQGRLVQSRQVSSRELVEAHLARIADVNPPLNAAVEVFRSRALAEADAADQRISQGKAKSIFDGVPFSVKDSIEIEGAACTAGTLGFRNRPAAKKDATLVAKLRAAGAIPVVRTNLPDLLFAFESDNFLFGRTNNPYNLERTSGGSSGGEAALIAACGSPFGLGSDAAGSVRLPAHFCGISSLKPTSGRLARTGHVPPAGGWLEMVWQIGPMARRVEDLCAMMPILLGGDGEDLTVIEMPYADPSQVPLGDLRVAFFTDNGVKTPDNATIATVRRAAESLQAHVRSVEESAPTGIDESYELEMKMIGPDGGDSLRSYLKSIGSDRHHDLLEGWLGKLEQHRTDLAGFAGYWADLQAFRSRMRRFLDNFDVILSPVAAFPALPHGHSIADDVFPGFSYTMTHNMTGWPAAVVRCGSSADGLPIGVQVAAAPWREDRVLAIVRKLEQLCGGWQPPGA